MAKNIMSEILPGEVDGWELLSLLKSRYGSAGHVSERSLVFPSQPDYALRVTWKEGRVSSIQAGKTFSAQEMQNVRSLIQACLIESPTSAVARGICSVRPRQSSDTSEVLVSSFFLHYHQHHDRTSSWLITRSSLSG